MKNLKVYCGKINKRNAPPVKQSDLKNDQWIGYDGNPIDSQHMIISLLLPPAVKEFMRQLESEINMLCGKRYEHGSTNQRWGNQPGSVILGQQKVRIERQRVRDKKTGQEVPLQTYQEFQNPAIFDESVLRDGLRKISQRDYEKGIPKIGASFGFTKSSVSRRFIKTMEKRLKELNERDISSLNITAVMIDGKRMGRKGVIIALGISEDGQKHVLGIYESSSENSVACHALLSDLELRGLKDRELLFTVDGGSGLNKALEERYNVSDVNNRTAVRVRCFVHKWNNLKSLVSDSVAQLVSPLFWAMKEAATLDIAKECSGRIEYYLKEHNESALKSFLEAKEDLLNIHRLRLTPSLKKFFSTTNPIESLNSLIEEDLRRVKNWKSSHQFQLWMATACLAGEKRMKRVRGFKALPALKVALKNMCADDSKELDSMVVNR